MSASFIVIPNSHSHTVSLMSVLKVTFAPFPSLLSSPSAPSSRASTSLPVRRRSWCQTPSAPACHWSESGRMAHSAPNTGYEPKLANFFSYTDPEHNPIDIPENNQFSCAQTTSQLFSAVQEVCQIPKHSAAAETAADSRVSSLFGHTNPRETECMRRTVGGMSEKRKRCEEAWSTGGSEEEQTVGGFQPRFVLQEHILEESHCCCSKICFTPEVWKLARQPSGKEDILVSDAYELKNLDTSEIHARRLNAMEVFMPKQ